LSRLGVVLDLEAVGDVALLRPHLPSREVGEAGEGAVLHDAVELEVDGDGRIPENLVVVSSTRDPKGEPEFGSVIWKTGNLNQDPIL